LLRQLIFYPACRLKELMNFWCLSASLNESMEGTEDCDIDDCRNEQSDTKFKKESLPPAPERESGQNK